MTAGTILGRETGRLLAQTKIQLRVPHFKTQNNIRRQGQELRAHSSFNF